MPLSSGGIEFYVDTESIIDGIPEVVFTNAYKENAPYYYFNAGDYKATSVLTKK